MIFVNELKIIKKEYGIFDKKGEFFADSLIVAKIFEKNHDDLLKTIRNLQCSKEFFTRNFCGVKYKKRGREFPKYEITRDGFTILVMGFTGEKAMQFKEAYINKFNEYEKYYNDRQKLRMESIYLTDSLKEFRESQGKETKFFHYSNEYDMINKIVLGMTAKQFKEKNGIDDNISSIRDYLTDSQIKEIERMQLQNAAMIQLGYTYEIRKESLSKLRSLRLN
jgi:Rha family phage regulatory protein